MFGKLVTVKPTDGKIKYTVKNVLRRIYEHNISQIGGQLSFFLILSTFPFLIFLNALIGYVNITPQVLQNFLAPLFPQQIVKLIGSYVEYISNNQSVSLLSIGIIVTIFSASKAVRAITRALNTAYGVEDRRSFVWEIVFSMLLILAVGVVCVLLIMVLAFSTNFVERLAQELNISFTLINIVDAWRWVTFAAVMFFVLSMMYKFMPTKKIRFREIIPGTLFSMAGFMALTVGFSVYVKYFMSNSALYGTIGSIILLMFWLYIVSMIIVVGAELNSVLSSMPKDR